jgi:DNA repair exonuclease SbcCD ATPase subunit
MVQQLSKIFHISDIHIRHGDHKQSRYSEYDQVFNNLYESIKEQINNLHLTQDDFIIIITGDVFHNKNVIGNYGLTLYKKFIQILTSLGRTIIFHGNHDRNQNETDQPSLISSTLDVPNLTILHDTQTFVIDNIGFSYLSIDDTLDITTTSGRVNNLPSFPHIPEPVHKKIALFHGTFANVKLYNGTDVTDTQNPYPFSLLEDFDFALLGDIHLRQKGLYQSTLWGYSGSLIQQNYGEDIINHGYLIWDLPSKSITEINVYNPYGMVNIKSANDTICIRKRGQYEPLASHITSEYFPKHIDVKLYSDVDITALLQLFASHNISCNIVNKLIQDDSPGNTTNNSSTDASLDIDTQIDKETLIQHFSNYLTPSQNTILSNIIRSYDNLLFDVAKYPDDLQDKCLKLNKELSTLIANCQNTQSTTDIRPQFTIKYIEWNNLFCYEGTQWIDFEKAEYSTFLVTGKNGTGKSAIYDILTLAIWGHITKLKQDKDFATGILNYRHNSANTIIDIECDNKKFRISRSFHLQAKEGKNNLNNAHTTVQKYLENNDIELYKSDNAANLEINKMFGTMEEFLTSSMITQNMDFDILKMDYKDVLSLVDQRFDIQYIYNLYELFKSSSKKYQDFKRIIEAKTEVYAKLLTTSSVQDATAVAKLEEELKDLESNRQSILTEFNAILIDINDPNNKHIINSDYDALISMLPPSSINNDEEYTQAQATVNDLKAILKGLPQSKIDQLQSHYTPLATLASPLSKPCEYSLIESEEDALKQCTQHAELLPKFKGHTIEDLKKLQETLKNKNSDITQRLNEHNNVKPITVQKPNYTEEHILTQITNNYDTLDNLIDFCKTNQRQTTKSRHQDQRQIHLRSALTDITDITKLQNLVPTIKEKLAKVDNEFRTLYNQKSQLKQVNRPEQSIKLKTSTSVKKHLNNTDINDLQSSLQRDTTIMETFYQSLDTIAQHSKELKIYQTELDTLSSNDEYSYNPECEHCCKRPWVTRIKQLQSLITDKNNIITTLNSALYDNTENDYLEIYTRLETSKQAVADYELFTNWLLYYMYKEQDEQLTTKINKLLASKEELNTNLNDTECQIQSLMYTIAEFNSISFDLLDKYETINAYKIYTTWKTMYDELQEKQATVQNHLKNVSEYLSFTNNVQPRIKKLSELKESYAKWQAYDQRTKINAAYKLVTLEKDVNTYSKLQEYRLLKSLQPLILRKTELAASLSNADENIRTLRNDLTEHNTIAAYNKTNICKHTMLIESLACIQDTIDLMTLVIDKFIDYRRELYATKILPKLTAATNKYISTLCHNTTKMFELDTIVTIYREKDIHINWLIKNKTEEDRKQTISIKQASGFQQFAISFAMRMSLFSNKTCNQLFIDEGFTACDKENLSIVPSFLRALLKTFKSIVIVSHIDLIQDSVDNIAHICFDKCKKSSSIHYGDQMQVTQRKRKIKNSET